MFSLTLLVGGFLIIAVLGGMVAVFLLNRRGADSFDRDPPAAPRPASSLGQGELAEVRAQLAAGRKIEAIRQVRKLTGLGLKEAKDFVESLERGPAPGPPARGPVRFERPASQEEVDAAARDLVAAGKTIEAIKLVREHTGLGLQEAKEYVEALG